MKRFVVLISGAGSNLAAIALAMRAERWPGQIVAVISNRGDAAGLARAHELSLPAEVLEHGRFRNREAFDTALVERVAQYDPDWILLAGFMRVLTPVFLDRFAGRVLNIHPSLLPSFTGLATHRQALAAGVRVHGATVHLVTAALDHGPIVAQTTVPVLDNDTEATLGARVLAAEHELYPSVVRWCSEGRLQVDGQRVTLSGIPASDRLLAVRS